MNRLIIPFNSTLDCTEKMKIWKPVGLAMILIAGSFSFWVWWTVNQAQLYQSKHGPEIRSEFGFAHGSPYVHAGKKEIEVLTIHPVKGGYLDKVGFRDGDIVTSESITGLYKLLHNSRGETISVQVVKGGDGAPIDQRETRTLTFEIPKKAKTSPHL